VFLEKFIEKDVKWLHCDIAPTIMNQMDPYGLRATVELLKTGIL